MNTPIVCDGRAGLNATVRIQAQDNDGNPFPANGTATVDDHTAAFLAAFPNNEIQILPKITLAPGSPTRTVNVTFQLNDAASGAALPPLVVGFDLVAPTANGQKATQVVVAAGPNVGVGSNATDPGTPSISISLT